MKTKRTMMLAVCMMLMLVLLTGCAESNLSGTWKLTDAQGVGELSGMDAGMLLEMAEAFGGSVLMKFEGKTMLDIIRENADLLGFELDVHWIHRGGCDPVSVIKDYAGKVELIHLKDYRIGLMGPDAFAALGKGDFKTFMGEFRNVVQFAEVGEGTLDMPAIIEASLECGAKQFFIEQDETYGRDAFDCLITSRDNLNKMGYELI